MRILAGYVAAMAVLIVAHYALPGLRPETWGLLGTFATAAVLAGVAIRRPRRKTAWLLLAAAIACSTIGQVSQPIVPHIALRAEPDPTVTDVVYLLGYPLYFASLLTFIRARGPIHDLRSTIDVLIMTWGLTLLAWIFLIYPYEIGPGSGLRRFVAIAYTVGAVAILGVLARLITPGNAYGWAIRLLVIGTAAGLASDVAHGLIRLYAAFGGDPAIIDLGWAIGYAALGAAALHPSMVTVASRGKPVENLDQPRATPVRMAVLLVTALIPPVYLVIRAFVRGDDHIEGVTASVCAALFALVIARLYEVNVSHRRSLDRERSLRRAGAALASARSVAEIGEIIREVVVGLIGHSPYREALLAVRNGDSLDIVATASGVMPPDNELARMAEGWLPRLRTLKSAQFWLFRAERLDPAEREAALRLGYGGLLLYPLWLTDRPSGDPLIGILAVFGEQPFLLSLSSGLGILASQVALALERVMLTQEVVRQRGEALFRALVQDVLDVILVLDDNMDIKYASPSAARLYGEMPAAGASAAGLVEEFEPVTDQSPVSPAPASSSMDVYAGPWRIRRFDGKQLLVQIRLTDLHDDPSVGGWVLTIRDVTDQYQLEEELKHQAFHDALTRLPNRALFTDRARHGVAIAKRNGTTAAVLIVDLDDFKVVNDTMGHAIGDELLAAAARRLTAVARESDTAARLGGDEFALLIENLPDPGAVESFASRVVAAFNEPFELSAGSVLATVTVGVATTRDSSDVDELLRHADLSLYAAKSDGKRRWHHYEPVLSAGMVRRREMQAALEQTVAESALRLVYQPIVDLATGEIRGFEALVRWPHPVLGTVPPGDFIDLAEETGLIIPLGTWILRQAVTDLARWRGSDPRTRQSGVSVNVSARQFRDPDFVPGLRRILDEVGLAPSGLMLELTESSLLRRDERIRSDLAELRDMGVRLAIDDFGTGYSSLSYLRELPIDVLKIDKTFVDAMVESAQGRAFAQLIIGFAKVMEIRVIAEGIETEEQLRLLSDMGCQLGQGFLLAMPMGWREAEVLLRTGQSFPCSTTRRGPPRAGTNGPPRKRGGM